MQQIILYTERRNNMSMGEKNILKNAGPFSTNGKENENKKTMFDLIYCDMRSTRDLFSSV